MKIVRPGVQWFLFGVLVSAYLAAASLAWLHFTQGPPAQRVNVRWAPSVTDVERARIERDAGLVDGRPFEGRTWQYFLRRRSRTAIQRLISNPRVEDTFHIDRATLQVQLDRADLSPRLRTWLESDRLGQISLALAVGTSVATWWLWVPLASIRAAVRTSVRQRARLSLGVWFFAIASILGYGREVAEGGDNWRTADWLITYMHGPVRRGLVGTLLYGISNIGLPWKWVVYAAQAFIYAATVAIVVRLYDMRKREIPWIAVLYSPAFLLFPHYTSVAGFRKEILVFLPLALFSLAYAQQRITQGRIAAVAALFVLAAFSHEIAAFTLPFFAGVIYLLWKDGLVSTRVAVRLAALFAVISCTAIASAFVLRADSTLVSALCESTRGHGFRPGICDGAIAWLDKDTAYAYAEKHIAIWPYVGFYGLVLLISIVPLGAVRWSGSEPFILAIAGLVGLVPVFAASIDWGRWIHVFVMCLFTVILADTARRPASTLRVPFILIVVYLVSWSIPICCAYTFDGGLVQQIAVHLGQR